MAVQTQSPWAKGTMAASWQGKAGSIGVWRASVSPWTGPGCTRATRAGPGELAGAAVQWRKERTHERERVRWKRWRRPRNMTKDRGGKERVDTSQKGISKAPAGHWQRKPPSAPLVQVPPLRHTPGTQRPERLSTSQFSPGGARREAWDTSRLGARTQQPPTRSLPQECRPQPGFGAGQPRGRSLWGSWGQAKDVTTRVLSSTVASQLATTASPAASAPGLDGMPAPAEGASLSPGWHRNGTGGDWPQLGCTVLRIERQAQAREVLVMLSVPPWGVWG